MLLEKCLDTRRMLGMKWLYVAGEKVSEVLGRADVEAVSSDGGRVWAAGA